MSLQPVARIKQLRNAWLISRIMTSLLLRHSSSETLPCLPTSDTPTTAVMPAVLRMRVGYLLLSGQKQAASCRSITRWVNALTMQLSSKAEMREAAQQPA